MKKTFRIDYSGDRLLATADSLFDEERYAEALRILNKNAALNGNDEVSYFLYAEIYDELGLHDKAIHNLFKSLDYEDEEDPSECYKGLAICYMNLGDRRMCSYYYGMYLSNGDGDYDDSMDDVRDFLNEGTPSGPLKFVYPPEIADFSDEFDKGVVQAMNDDTKEAIKTFDKIPEGNRLYDSARMNIATCHLIMGNYDAAEDECRMALQKDPDNMQAYINLANVYLERKQPEKARDIAREKFTDYKTDNREEMYKIATIYCETGMHKEAYECFTYMVNDLDTYHLNVLFFRAVAAFNAKMGREALDAINLMLEVYPVSVNALYTKSVIYQAVRTRKYFPMEYAFGLPDNMANEYMSLLESFTKMSRTRAREIYKETEIVNAILWSFDGEYMEDKTDLQDAALSVAVKIGEYDIVRDYLLERRLANKVKMDALIDLSERNIDEAYGIVISDIMFRARFKKIKIGRKCHTQFLRAYGTIVARFSFIDEALGEIIAPFAEKIYVKMEAAGILDLSEDTPALALAMYIKAGQGFDKVSEESMAIILGTDEATVNSLAARIGEV